MSGPQTVPRAEDFRVHRDIEVRFRDLDGMAHVNNAVYATYFEVARVAYVKALGHADPDGPLEALQPFIMLEMNCRFLAQVRFGEDLVVHIRTVSIGTKSFAFEYLLCRRKDGAAVATGRSTQVYFSYADQETLPIPEGFRNRIERLEGRAMSENGTSVV
ncbi:MAG: thioesterase family protein [Deltaproteobacteria bacterium]